MKKKHSCPTCGLIASSKANLNTHLKTHTGEKPFKCNDCGKTFSRKFSLKRHLIEVHSGQGQLTVVLKNCPICDKLVSTRFMYGHMNLHNKPFQCNHCGKSLSSKSILANHLLIHTENREKPFECNDCGKVTVHSKDKMPKEKNCTICDKLISIRTMDTHMRIHTRPFQCNDCGKNFAYKHNLQNHISHRHTGEALKKKEKCPVCEKMLFNMRQHLMIHTGLKPFECTKCGKAFTSNNLLSVHMRSVHKTGNPLKCDHCNKVFYMMNHLKNHMKIHTGEKPHHCTVCDMRFANRSSFLIHKGKHTGERPYIYSYCEKTFISRFILTQHERSHNEEKTFKCSTCSKAFSQYANMKRHMKGHQEAQPFICTKCSKTFKHSFYGKKHFAICRAKRGTNNGSDDKEPKYNASFLPVLEQFGPHQMKKCSVFIKRIGYIEDAVCQGYRSIDVSVSKRQ